MGVQKLYFYKTQFVFLFKKMFFFIRVLCVSFFTCVFTLFSFTRQSLLRFQEMFNTQKKNSISMLIKPIDDQPTIGNEMKVEENNDLGEDENEKSESNFRFRFPTYEEFLQNDNGQSLSHSKLCNMSDNVISHVESKDDYVGSEFDTIAKSTLECLHVEEKNVEQGISSKIVGLSKENNGISLDESFHVENVIQNDDFSLKNDTQQNDAITDHVGDVKGNSVDIEVENGEGLEGLVNDSTNNEDLMNNGSEFSSCGKSMVNGSTNNEDVMKHGSEFASCDKSFMNSSSNDADVMNHGSESTSCDKSLMKGSKINEEVMRNRTYLPSDDESLVSDSDSDSMAPSSVSSFRSSFIDSLSDGVLSDIDFERAFEVDTSKEFDWNEVNSTKEGLSQEDFEFQTLLKGYEADDFADEDEDILEELKNLESNIEGDTAKNGDYKSLESKFEGYDHDSAKDSGADTNNEAESKQNDEKTSSGEQLSSDSDEQNGLETQWEHQHLVEQLKMEIKKVRAIGLPTILEESESPKITDDLKPWKIKEKYQHKGNTTTMDELHTFYKSYKERMRKLDILNYQKMYAIGFLRLKDPLQSFTKNKISTPALATIVSLDCWPCKPKSISEIHQPVLKKFSKELESDLELVYVGQLCLSWEFLRWQYGKALELWESDPHGIYRYNEVADKFQTFQVLLTRFLEDEAFQGPRVYNYVKNRCVHRNLLQVPLIQDDTTRDRKKERKVVSSKDAITSLQLVETMEESIRILWRFIKTDKDTGNNLNLLKCRRSSSVELQNPADASLLEEIRSTLHKKEKKLKELSRSEKCILRKIHKNEEEDGSDHVMYFFSQVDMRLVSRVLNMPRITTEQLVWCSDKLSNINLVGRKLHVETSVLLFPC